MNNPWTVHLVHIFLRQSASKYLITLSADLSLKNPWQLLSFFLRMANDSINKPNYREGLVGCKILWAISFDWNTSDGIML